MVKLKKPVKPKKKKPIEAPERPTPEVLTTNAAESSSKFERLLNQRGRDKPNDRYE